MNTIKISITVLPLLAVQFLLFGSCNKNNTKPCLNGGYSFNATSEWFPQQKIYNVGDTIYLSSTISRKLTDQINTSLVIDYSNSVGINGDLSISILDSVSRQVIPARDSFDVLATIGEFKERTSNQKSGVNFFYNETASNYQFKGSVICRKMGVYVIYVSNLLSRGLRGKNCTNASFDMIVINTDKHSSLWKNALQMVPDNMHIKNMYCFRVQ